MINRDQLYTDTLDIAKHILEKQVEQGLHFELGYIETLIETIYRSLEKIGWRIPLDDADDDCPV